MSEIKEQEKQQEQQQEQQQEEQKPQQQSVNLDLDEINEILKEKYNQMLLNNIPIETPQQPIPKPEEKSQTPEQQDDTLIPIDVDKYFKSEEDITPQNVSKALKEVYTKAVEDVYKTIPIVIAKIASELFTPMYLAQQFFDKYPQMEKYSPLIAHMISKIKTKEPNKSPREIMEIVENEVKNMLELINKPDIKTSETKTKQNTSEQDSYYKRLAQNYPDKEVLEKISKLGW